MINLSSVSDPEQYALSFTNHAKCDISDIHSYKTDPDESIQIHRVVPHFFADYSMPLIYLVDRLDSIQNNHEWTVMRDIENDLVLDSNGNLAFLRDIVVTERRMH